MPANKFSRLQKGLFCFDTESSSLCMSNDAESRLQSQVAESRCRISGGKRGSDWWFGRYGTSGAKHGLQPENTPSPLK